MDKFVRNGNQPKRWLVEDKGTHLQVLDPENAPDDVLKVIEIWAFEEAVRLMERAHGLIADIKKIAHDHGLRKCNEFRLMIEEWEKKGG